MKTISLLAGLTVLVLAPGCQNSAPRAETNAAKSSGSRVIAMATLSPASGSAVRGVVSFIQMDGKVRVEAQVSGLSPGEHGFHIHEKGDCSAPDASSAGGHYNPDGMPHAGPSEHRRHVGDFGNLKADASGVARYSMAFPNLTLAGTNSILGKAVIVHAQPDDLKTQPTGNAGGRVACGVIESAKAD